MTASTPILDHVRQAIADAEAAGQPAPGRPKLAAALGVSQHRVRQALEELAREQAPVPASSQEPPAPPVDPAPEPAPILAPEPVPDVEPEPAADAPAVVVAPEDTKPPIHRAWLALLALPAFVAVWGGWVGLGGLAGFGPVNLLPGMPIRWVVNLAITLPAGMEVYAVIGLRVWLSGRTRSTRTRTFAARSSFAALAIGCLGQIAYHVLARPPHAAPMFITVAVACLPVAILGVGAALFHLIGEDQRAGATSIANHASAH